VKIEVVTSGVARIRKMLGHKFVDASAHRAEATRGVWGHAPPQKNFVFLSLSGCFWGYFRAYRQSYEEYRKHYPASAYQVIMGNS